MARELSRTRGAPAALAAALVGVLAIGAPSAAEARRPDPAARLAKDVKVDRVLDHLEELQEIADDNGGNRAAGQPGYSASVDYLVERLRKGGYQPQVQSFTFPFAQDFSVLHQLSPTQITYVNETDFLRNMFDGSPQGEATGTVVGVDLALPPPPAPGSTSGCEREDFATFPSGSIALVQRGTCDFTVKALNAQAAGASGVLVMNEGQEGRTGIFGMSGDGSALTIPVVSTTFEVGAALAAAQAPQVHMEVSFSVEERTTYNVIAQTRRGNTDNVVMAGAHLDSVQVGPGINDNGSGSAALLEVAEEFGRQRVNNAVRFAWWGAEEEGLLGAEHYVGTLDEAERDRIALYLNFDMVASPNYTFGIYDGDNSGETAPDGFIPAGSAEIEDLFEAFYQGRGLPFEDSEFSGRSDYGPFIAVGIPAGGLFTGAEGVKTPAQAARFGGLAGVAFDPCYHQACDNLTGEGQPEEVYGALDDLEGNINVEALDVNTDAIATAVATFAADTSVVNGYVTPPRGGRADLRVAGSLEGHAALTQ